MNLKKLVSLVKDTNRTRQERMYILLVLCGLFGLFCSSVIGTLMGENLTNILAMAVAFIVLLGIVYYTIRSGHIQLGAVTIAFLVIFIMLPLNFLSSGSIYGGGPIWFLFGIIFVCLVVENKIKYFFIGGGFLVCGASYWIAYYYPSLVVSHTEQIAFTDSFLSLVIVTVIICAMILFQNRIYESENEKAQIQKKEIEELNKMQNQFFSSMSHEIRTPINTIIGLNEMILREDVSDEVAADAKSIQGASKMLLSLINDILDMSKIESGKMDIVPVPYDVGNMLSDIVNMIWVRAKEKNLEFHIDLDQTMPTQLYGDEVRIKQILINVLNNAVKYTSEGSVTLSIQCKVTENNIAQIVYTVTDTGMGIKKENLPYLFSAFKRIDEEKNRYIEGTGLGLSIVKQLVELMHGEITVNSVYRKGSSFVITIPQEVLTDETINSINFEERHKVNSKQQYKQSFEASKANILIVDDNDDNLMVATKLLRDTKVQITTALSGEECLRETLKQHYDVIFLDHLMPHMSGIECLHEIRKQIGGFNQNTPVIVLTANSGSDNLSLYRREGFDEYLLKPVTGQQLEEMVFKFLPKNLIEKTLGGELLGAESPMLEHHHKKLVLITTDSVCDLPKAIIEREQIPVMPYRVHTKGGIFLDGVEVETDGIISYMEENSNTVASESPDIADYEEFFAECLAKAQYIIHISMAKEVSKGFFNATEAAKNFENVVVVDSGHLSGGLGLLVLQAIGYAAEGLSASAIVDKLESDKLRIKTSFIVDKTDFLARSGRISPRIDSLCNAIMLHPVLALKNSYMKVAKILIGRQAKVRKDYILSEMKVMKRADTKTLFIAYVGLSRQELDEIKALISTKYSYDRIYYIKASSAISANCGPGSFGLLYMVKE